jgi:hypothetical protein
MLYGLHVGQSGLRCVAVAGYDDDSGEVNKGNAMAFTAVNADVDARPERNTELLVCRES